MTISHHILSNMEMVHRAPLASQSLSMRIKIQNLFCSGRKSLLGRSPKSLHGVLRFCFPLSQRRFAQQRRRQSLNNPTFANAASRNFSNSVAVHLCNIFRKHDISIFASILSQGQSPLSHSSQGGNLEDQPYLGRRRTPLRQPL